MSFLCYYNSAAIRVWQRQSSEDSNRYKISFNMFRLYHRRTVNITLKKCPEMSQVNSFLSISPLLTVGTVPEGVGGRGVCRCRRIWKWRHILVSIFVICKALTDVGVS